MEGDYQSYFANAVFSNMSEILESFVYQTIITHMSTGFGQTLGRHVLLLKSEYQMDRNDKHSNEGQYFSHQGVL